MDYLRSCYTCKMRLWADRDQETEVRWFFADKDAKEYPHPHVFGSKRTWEEEGITGVDDIGEVEYLQYDKGANPLGYKGQKACGSKEAFYEGGRAGRDPVITTGPGGYSPCCGPLVVLCEGAPWPGDHLPGRLTVTGASCHCLEGETDWILNYDPDYPYPLPNSYVWVTDYRHISGCPGHCGAPSRLRWGVRITHEPGNPCDQPHLFTQWEGQHPVSCYPILDSDATKDRVAGNFSFNPFTGYVTFGYGGDAGDFIFAQQSPATPNLNCNATTFLATSLRFEWNPQD